MVVTDKKDGTRLYLAHIQVVFADEVMHKTPNKEGVAHFLIPDNVKSVKVSVTHVGYFPKTQTVHLPLKRHVNIGLQQQTVSLRGINVLTEKARRNGINVHYFSPKTAELQISAMGEADIMQQIQTLPGVAQGMEGSLGLFVRGSNNGNNRIAVDGVPIYAPTHLFGLLSVFQPEPIQQVSFRMGGVTADMGNFLSSSTDIKTKSPFFTPLETKISLSPFIIGGYTNIPIKKQKIGVLVGGRYSLLRQQYLALKKMTGSTEADINPQISDVYTKVSFHPNAKNSFEVSAFYTNDYFGFTDRSEIVQNWSNNFIQMTWKNRTHKEYNWNTSLYYNGSYNIQKQRHFNDFEDLESALMISSGIREFAAKTKVTYSINQYDFIVGADLQYSTFRPASEKVLVSDTETKSFDTELQSQLAAIYASTQYNWGKQNQLRADIRSYIYHSDGYSNLQADIRLLFHSLLTENMGIEISYDEFSQFHHVLEGLPTGWSLTVMAPADRKFKPSKAHQLYTGVYYLLGKYHFNLGAYAKQMNRLVSYKSTQNLFGISDVSWQDELTVGNGRSFGLEFMAKRKADRWNFMFAYTLSKTDRRFEAINSSERFPFKFDRRHVLNMNMDYLVMKNNNKQQKAFASIAFTSGHNATLNTGYYPGVLPPYWDQRNGGTFIPQEMNNQAYMRQHMSGVNAFTLPYYLRLDVGYTFSKKRKKYSREFTLSLFNATNRRNPYLYFHENRQWKQLSIFPIVPSFRWRIHF